MGGFELIVGIVPVLVRKLGYADFKNISFENRAAGGDRTSLDVLAFELANLNRDW